MAYSLSTEGKTQTDDTGRFATAPARTENPARRLPPKNLPRRP
ncbi:hypothetical protein [Kitasatospora griseola]